MTIQEALKTYREKISAMHALGHAMGVLHYDGATVAPVESAEGRGKTLAYLSGCAYEIETGKELSEAAKYLNEHKEELNAQDRREIEVFLRESEFTASIPQAEYVAYVELLNKADAVWHKAKAESDFPAFAPIVKEIFETNVRFAKYYKPDQAPYDTQLGLYERGLTMEKTDAFFNALKERIVPLLKKVQAKPQVDEKHLINAANRLSGNRAVYTFRDCTALETVRLPVHVKLVYGGGKTDRDLAAMCFNGCTALKTLILGDRPFAVSGEMADAKLLVCYAQLAAEGNSAAIEHVTEHIDDVFWELTMTDALADTVYDLLEVLPEAVLTEELLTNAADSAGVAGHNRTFETIIAYMKEHGMDTSFADGDTED